MEEARFFEMGLTSQVSKSYKRTLAFVEIVHVWLQEWGIPHGRPHASTHLFDDSMLSVDGSELILLT